MNKNSIEQFPNHKGLLWSYRLDGAGGGQQQVDLTKLDKTGPVFDWIHLLSNEQKSIDWMIEKGLSSQVIEMMNATNTRPRMQKLDGGLLINLRGVNTNPGADPEDMVALRIWFTNDTIITTRSKNRKLLSVEDLRETIESKTGPTTTRDFVCMLIKYIANRIGDVVDDIDEALSQVETNLVDDNINQVQQQLFSTRTKSAAIRRYLSP
ncbi:MAG: zinc transporter, partial [Gammaproteobacteria bacterium]